MNLPLRARDLAPAPDAMPLISLVVCTLDEAAAIPAVLDAAGAALTHVAHEIIVVDDSAGEATADAVRAHPDHGTTVRLIHRRTARGLASAAIAGWDAARGEVLALMDGDGQHDAALLPGLLAEVERPGVDLAVASRYARGGGALAGRRNLISRAGTALVQRSMHVTMTDPLAGFFAMRREWYVAARPALTGVGFKILADVASAGMRTPVVRELPTALGLRIGGESKLGARVMVDLLGLALAKVTHGGLPARGTLFGCVAAAGLAVQFVVMALMGGRAGLIGFGAAIGAGTLAGFAVNAWLTFRDRRPEGGASWGRSALLFCLSCGPGAAMNAATAVAFNRQGWPLALLAGGAAGAAINFALARGAVWRT